MPPLQSFFYPINNAERAARPPHLIVGGDVLDAPETIRFSLRIGVLPRFEFLPVGTGVLDGPETKEF